MHAEKLTSKFTVLMLLPVDNLFYLSICLRILNIFSDKSEILLVEWMRRITFCFAVVAFISGSDGESPFTLHIMCTLLSSFSVWVAMRLGMVIGSLAWDATELTILCSEIFGKVESLQNVADVESVKWDTMPSVKLNIWYSFSDIGDCYFYWTFLFFECWLSSI